MYVKVRDVEKPEQIRAISELRGHDLIVSQRQCRTTGTFGPLLRHAA
jgi:hypothetical protein